MLLDRASSRRAAAFCSSVGKNCLRVLASKSSIALQHLSLSPFKDRSNSGLRVAGSSEYGSRRLN